METKEFYRMLYQNAKTGEKPNIDMPDLITNVLNGAISLDDALEITTAEDGLEISKSVKLQELSKACHDTIVAGVDVELDGELAHFNLSTEDQANISNLFRFVELGGTSYPYQSDGGVCRIYTAQEIVKIYLAAQTHITTQTTYHNAIKSYVQSCTDFETVISSTYGMDLPKPYNSDISKKLSVATKTANAILGKYKDE